MNHRHRNRTKRALAPIIFLPHCSISQCYNGYRTCLACQAKMDGSKIGPPDRVSGTARVQNFRYRFLKSRKLPMPMSSNSSGRKLRICMAVQALATERRQCLAHPLSLVTHWHLVWSLFLFDCKVHGKNQVEETFDNVIT